MLGNTAVFGGVITQVSAGAPFTAGNPFLVSVVDNGPPGSGTPDLISSLFVLGSLGFPLTVPQDFPNICPPATTFPAFQLLTSGDIVVEDESAPGLAATG